MTALIVENFLMLLLIYNTVMVGEYKAHWLISTNQYVHRWAVPEKNYMHDLTFFWSGMY